MSIIAAVANSNRDGTEILCTILLVLWVVTAVLAVISLLIKPIVDARTAILVALVLFVIWLLVC